MSRVEELLQQCTVKLSLASRMGWGTGFFVAPEWILTCAHLVREKGKTVQVRWQMQQNWSQAVVEELRPDPYDLALLRVTLPNNDYPPCVYLDGAIQSRDPLYLFGYPDQDFDNGCPVTFNCEGLTGDEPGLIKFKLGQVRPGMSGAPLLNQRTGKVCGIVKLTLDRSFDLGGGAVPTTAILEQLPQLRDLEEATTALTPNQELKRIPVLVELRYWQGSITQLILNAFTRHELPLTQAQLETVLSRSLILFDGVNELPSEEARSQLSDFRRNHPKVPMIFTTRDLSLGGDLGIEQKLEMQPLTEAQMQAFIQAYLPEQAEEMLRQLGERLREFGQTPLLLWMLCSLFQQTNEIPENLGLVFRLFTQGYERNLKQDVVIESDRDWWKSVLQQLAWVMMQGETSTELRVGIPREEAVQAIAQFLNGKVAYEEDFARKCLRDLQKYHLIQAGTGNEELEFRHQLIQEYVEDSDFDVCCSAADALGNIAKKDTEAITQYLPHLLTLIPTDSGENALSVILTIQENCKFYNYEIWQEALSRG